MGSWSEPDSAGHYPPPPGLAYGNQFKFCMIVIPKKLFGFYVFA